MQTVVVRDLQVLSRGGLSFHTVPIVDTTLHTLTDRTRSRVDPVQVQVLVQGLVERFHVMRSTSQSLPAPAVQRSRPELRPVPRPATARRASD